MIIHFLYKFLINYVENQFKNIAKKLDWIHGKKETKRIFLTPDKFIPNSTNLSLTLFHPSSKKIIY